MRRIILLVAVLLPIVFIGTASAATTWTVDDDGGAQFTKIQDAVDAASNGDTIIVRDGTYTENINVNKRLTIQSENGYKNCIVRASDSDDYVFEVTADYVNIYGFAVMGATGEPGIYLYGVNHCEISNNDVTNNEFGIYLLYSDSNTITANTVNSNVFDGIYLYGSSSNIITNNTASKNRYGIYLGWSSNYNTVTNNSANSNDYYGIDLSHSSENTIMNNEASNNPYGVGLSFSDNNTVTANVANSNDNHGVRLYKSSNNTLEGNTMNDNGDNGIILESSDYNSLTDNYGYGNTNDGIHVMESSHNTLDNNTLLYSDSRDGIWLYKNSNYNSLFGNKCTSNSRCGIEVSDGCISNTITSNKLSGNEEVGIYLHSTSATVQPTVTTDFDRSPKKPTDSDMVPFHSIDFNFTESITLEEPEVSGSQVTLSWSKTSSSGFTAYILFRATHPDVRTTDTYVEEFLSSTTTSYTDTPPGPGTYYYRIYEMVFVPDLEAFVWTGSNEQSVTVQSTATSLEKPADSDRVPFDTIEFNLSRAVVLEEPEVSGSQVTLSWSKTASPGFTAYIIFRATHPSVRMSDTYVVEFLSSTTTAYTDTPPVPGTYYYRIYEMVFVPDFEAFVWTGSNEQSVTVQSTATSLEKPADSDRVPFDTIEFNLSRAVVLEEPEVSGSQVTLSWSKTASPSFTAYIIFRATNPDVRTTDTYVEEFLTAATTSYTDTPPGPGTYYYRIYEMVFVLDLGTFVWTGSNEQSVTYYPNIIYNNYFSNTKNAYDDGNNVWSVTKASGKNIAGGSYLGGNYWSDYAGVDTDGDALGDTSYGISGGVNKDYLPLVGIKPTVSIYTDKTSYSTGDTMYLGLDVNHPLDSAQQVNLDIYLEQPTGGTVTLLDRAVTLSAGLDYSNPDFKKFRLPSLSAGTYRWHAVLEDPVTDEIICEDIALWEFVSTGTPTEDITEMMEQTTVVIDFGEEK